MKNKKRDKYEYDEETDIDFDLPEDFEGNDIPLTLDHIDGKTLYRESMEDNDDDYYLWLMRNGEEARKRSGAKENRRICTKE